MTTHSSAPGIPLYVPSFPSLFNHRSNLQNDVEEEDAYANDDGRDAFLLAGLRRPGPVDPYNPYAEPSEPSSMPEDQYGPAIDPIFEKLLPTEETPSNFYVEPHRRKSQDVVFSVLFLLALSAMYIVGIAYLSTTKSGSGDGIRKTIYETLRNSVPLIATATCIAVGGGALWLLLFGRYVRQIMYLSVILIPVLFITLFVVTFANSIVRKFYDAPFLGPQYSGMRGMSFVFLLSGLMSGFFVYRKRQQVEQTIDIIELSFAILRHNPRIFLLSIVLMIGYAVFSLTWILMFARLFLKGYFKVDPTGSGGHWEVTGGTGWAATFFILVYFWTSANFHNVEKVTIAGVVGEWFFASGETEGGARSDRTLKHLKVALTTSFGSICFASLILGIVETSQYLLRQARKVSF
ncbi:hypothetical protein HDV00_009291 [Rhizophlyctis rosea]|nr:hypothetical protein HDV00_009291 [Rhizophlyctis rosea]